MQNTLKYSLLLKYILLLLLFQVVWASANSQLFIGIKQGANFCQMSYKNSENKIMPEKKISLNSGIRVVYKYNNYFSLSTEVSYSGKGAKFTYENKNISELSIEYFEMPFLLNFKLPITPLYLYTGSFFAIVSNANNTLTSNTGITKERLTSKTLSGFDYGIIAGTGIIFGDRNIKFFADYSISIGVTDIMKTNAIYKTKTSTIMAGILFKL